MMDLAFDPINARLASQVGIHWLIISLSTNGLPHQFYQAGKIVSAVCHGPGCVPSILRLVRTVA